MSSGQAGQTRPAPKIRGQAGGRENNKAAQSCLRPKNLYFRMLPQNHQLTSQVNTPGFQAEEVDTGGEGTARAITTVPANPFGAGLQLSRPKPLIIPQPSLLATGRATMNAAPKPGSLSTQIEPPAESTLVRATASPKPCPPGLVVYSRRKILS